MAKRFYILGKKGPDTYAMEKLVGEVLRQFDLKRCTIHIIEDDMDILRYGVGLFPALVIDDVVRIIGRVPPKAEIENLLRLIGDIA